MRPVLLIVTFLLWFAPGAQARLQSGEVRVWEVQEITLASARDHANPYVDVECWVELEGPDFRRRVYGFWDGGRIFKVRIVATRPGDWTWRVGSNRADDQGCQAPENSAPCPGRPPKSSRTRIAAVSCAPAKMGMR